MRTALLIGSSSYRELQAAANADTCTSSLTGGSCGWFRNHLPRKVTGDQLPAMIWILPLPLGGM